MNKTFPLEQVSETVNLGSNLILRQYKLDLSARFLEIKSVNPKFKRSQIAADLGCSSSTLQRYRNDIHMFSPYKIPPNSFKKRLEIQPSLIFRIVLMTLNDLN